jgi:hypothetical protein
MRKAVSNGCSRPTCLAHLSILLGALVLSASVPTRGAAQVSAPIAGTAQKSPTEAERARKIATQLRESITKCWTIEPTPSAAAASTQVTVEFELKRSGALSRKPHIVNQRGTLTNVPLAASAIRAVEACAPYTNLPPELFETGWRHVRLTFDTSARR